MIKIDIARLTKESCLATAYARVRYLKYRLMGAIIPDQRYMEMRYRRMFGRKPSLANPSKLSEKIQWLMLNQRQEILPQLVDKYAVREFVRGRVGAHVLSECYGVWSRVEEIDLDQLPDAFALKPTHNCGGHVFCRDKSNIDWRAAKAKLKRRTRENYYYFGREWPYKLIQPRIMCEELLQDEQGNFPWDYKFVCLNAVPRFVAVHTGRFINHVRSFYDMDWNLLPFSTTNVANSRDVVPKPDNLERMAEIASQLSKDLPFCRVDLYSLGDRIVFGEMTLYPACGLLDFAPREYDDYFGELLRLPVQAVSQPKSAEMAGPHEKR